jgi:hypothetical protein
MVAKVISKERLAKYLIATGHNEATAVKLYGWNIQISESFFPLLSASEVCLRNIISTRMIELYGNQWWDNAAYLAQIGRGKRIVKTAQDNLRKKGSVTSGGMTAELNFGFWSKMLLPRHKEVFWEDVNESFCDLPATVTYEDLYDRCDQVRIFRNRIFHHEPIFNRDISREYSQIMKLITWFSPEKAAWIKGYTRVMVVLREKPR